MVVTCPWLHGPTKSSGTVRTVLIEFSTVLAPPAFRQYVTIHTVREPRSASSRTHPFISSQLRSSPLSLTHVSSHPQPARAYKRVPLPLQSISPTPVNRPRFSTPPVFTKAR
ncbi:hypothetical protein CEP52_005533 [Fusarium oligoseptatum]|uniref:Uncharacterized protein n=1 Tax=Fusarium oligoseptatum TaxID=2604345 RepID=A0A428TXW9_9HYPO|nr:hypothetical protein CEP52_005533 [Fusarium oligoseptatum]